MGNPFGPVTGWLFSRDDREMRMRCPVLVGREAEQSAIRDLVRGSAASDGQALFLTGEPGIGKSALLRSAVQIAQSAGVETLLGRAVTASSPVPFRPLQEALLSSMRRRGLPAGEDLRPFQPALARLIPHLAVPQTEPVENSSVVLAEGLLRLLRLIRPHGCVLVLDDLQWADPDTMAVVEYLCDNLAGEPVGLIGALRDIGQLQTFEALRARRSAAVLHLQPLGHSDVVAMIAACPLPQGFPADRVAEVIAAAEGIPLLVEEVLSVASESTDGSTLSLPGTVAEMVRLRLSGLDGGTREVLVCAALLGRGFDWRLLEPATGLDEKALQEALWKATALELLDTEGAGFRFRHALTRDAVLAAVLAPERSRLAMATCAAVEAAHPELPDEWCIIAADLHEVAGDQDGAARLLVAAGIRALRQAALNTAEQLARRASELGATPERAAESAELLAEVLAAAGRVDEAVEIAHRWLAMSHHVPAQRTRMQLLLARAAVAGERWQLALEQLDGSAAAVAAGNGAFAAEHAALSAQVAIGTGRVEDAAALAGTALQAAEVSGRPEAACEALEVIGRVERLGSLTAARAAFQRSATLAETNGLAVWYLRALHELGTVDMFENARLDRLAYARERATESGALVMVAILDVQLAGGLWVRGEFAQSLDAGRRAAAAGRRFRIDGIHHIGLCFAAVGHGPLIDPIRLEAGAAALAAVSDAAALAASIWGDGWTVYALLTEDRARALRSIEQAAELGRAGDALPSPWWGLWPLLRAVAGTDADEAIAAATHVVPSGWSEMMIGYTRAVALGRRGQTARAEASFARDDATMPWPWWRHLGRRLVAEAALQDGWGEPITWLREAASFFDDFPAPAVASACRSMLRRAGASVPRARRTQQVAAVLAVRGVTERESEVLGLVGQGLSNAEVAERLFLSPRTVEKHVENLARKLGTGTRSQLVAYAASVDRTT